ncbi:LLM class flavin-dependent oxidoreductase [Staphylococcus equorum]|uniref:LLM class flavin-dependent oxidoreductase n=1 Tax=Staphylococcus equorum TaxID=246432 RepID=A0A9X4L7I5_9STAP|nr:LLM class flavin-dependent oxidoreductase [Staphylococcus equorum]MDG0841972.1 LLM class flavin-dependent oxidoreductase [Staphylococcus equorum]MDG0857976.1 LLM class flavin-dependent oxidoreductase [Staphylococcus equorum]
MPKKQIHFNGFVQNSPSPHSSGLWKHNEDQGAHHNQLDYWINIAQTLEKGKFDSIFIADVLGTYSVYNQSSDAAIKHAVQLPAHDPIPIISAMAAVTKHIGFAPTISTTYAQPYSLARQLSTLDHLTNGRLGWNVVTSYLESEAINLGLKERLPKDLRYNKADEFLQVVYKLWEESWEDGSVINDKATDTYADPDKVHEINHEGEFFSVPGPHLVEPSPQRTPVLFQAGASEKGKTFAAKHAEAVFTKHTSVESLKRYVDDIHTRAEKHGRSKEDILVFPMVLPIIGETEEEAYQKYEALTEHISYEGSASLLSGHTGIDFSEYDPDQYIEDIETEAMQGNLNMYTKDPHHKWTLREAVKNHGLGNGTAKFIGTKEQVADKFEAWTVEGGAAGFNIAQSYSPGTFEEFVEHVIPELQKRGLYRTEYEGTTLRENMFGKDQKTIKENHPAKNKSAANTLI